MDACGDVDERAGVPACGVERARLVIEPDERVEPLTYQRLVGREGVGEVGDDDATGSDAWCLGDHTVDKRQARRALTSV